MNPIINNKKHLNKLANTAPQEEKTFALLRETGEIIELKPSLMKKIIKDDEGLLKQFNDERNKEGMILEYVRMYNQYNQYHH